MDGYAPFIKDSGNILNSILGLGEKQKVEKNAILLFPGNHVNKIYYLIDGKMQYSLVLPNSREVILGFLEVNSIFGEAPFYHGYPGRLTIKAVRKSEVIAFTREQFKSLLNQNNTEVLEMLIHSLCMKFRMALTTIENMGDACPDSRVARLLFYYASANRELPAVIKLTHEQIANMTGLHRVTVTKVLSFFKEKELIVLFRNQIIIKDLSSLENIMNSF